MSKKSDPNMDMDVSQECDLLFQIWCYAWLHGDKKMFFCLDKIDLAETVENALSLPFLCFFLF